MLKKNDEITVEIERFGGEMGIAHLDGMTLFVENALPGERVLARAQELLEQSADMAQAREVLTSALPELTREAQQVLAAAGCGDGVRARLEPAEFPTKDYDGFSLPAGKYLALRVIIGEGRGQNWWCVVFPPLCTAAACDWQDAGRDAGLAEDDLSLMAEEDQGYQLRFRSVELWEKLRQWLGK